MAVFYCRGDLFLSSAQTLAHGCNCQGKMGRGIARELKARFPEVFSEYRRRCQEDTFKPGGAYLEKSTNPWVLNLATQATSGGAKLGFVENCLLWLAHHHEREGVLSVAMPQIGAGLGGLPWEEVRALIDEILGPLTIPVYVYEEFAAKVRAKEDR